MTMTLQEAIAEVQRSGKEWTTHDFYSQCEYNEGAEPSAHVEYAPIIFSAVASGDLIPKADAEQADWRKDPESNEAWCAGNQHALDRLCAVVKADPAKVVWDGSDGSLNEETDALIWRILRHDEDDDGRTSAERDAEQAVALAYQKAADQVSMSAPGRWLVVETDRVKAAILALADAGALAEVQALRAERDDAQRLMRLRHGEMLAADTLMQQHQRRAEAAEAEVARLKKAGNRLVDNMAFLLNHAEIPNGWYDKLLIECEEDRAALGDAG